MVELASGSAPHFVMGRNCVWDGELHKAGDLNNPCPGDPKRDKGLSTPHFSIMWSTGLYLVSLKQEG